MQPKLLNLLRKVCFLLPIVMVSSLNGSAQSGSTLVGLWKMEEGSGATLIDNSGNGNNAVLQNAKDITWGAGKQGLALFLPGTTSRFGIAPNQASLNIPDKITIAAWVNPAEIRNCTILSKTGNDGYALGLASTGKVEFQINSNTNGLTYKVYSNSNYVANGTTWTHVAATFDGTTSKIYINGILDIAVTFPAPVAIITNTSGLYIGSLLGDRRWRGGLDEVRLYRGALTATEIGPLAGVIPPAAPTLIAPANGATNLEYTQTLSFNSVPSATRYKIEVSTASDFSTTVLSQDNLTTTSVQISNLNPNTVHYWRVRAGNNGGDGDWSSVWQFKTAVLTIPEAPDLISPANGATNMPFNPIFNWNAVFGALKYRLEVSTDASFASTVAVLDNLQSLSAQVSNLLANTQYYWRVRASNAAGNGAWSAVWNFTTNQPATTGFASLTRFTPFAIAGNTADKPQAKVWMYDNRWWSVISTDQGTRVFRLDGTVWTSILTISTSSATKSDCVSVGSVTHILLYRSSNPSYISSIEYDFVNKTYKLWSQRPDLARVNLDAGVETAVMTIDGTGRMWVANAGVNDIFVRWSDAPYSTFSAPISIANDVNDDDICAIAAMPGKIGVLWGNQNTHLYGFKTHTNGNSPASWSADEKPASQSALDIKSGIADDHLAMIAGADGTLYCAIKTGYDSKTYPMVGLLVRRPSGVWDNLYPVAYYELGGSRPMVILNEAMGKVKVVYTTTGSRRDIVYREASTSNIVFGNEMPLLADGKLYDYSSSTHQVYNSQVVIVATDQTNMPKKLIGVIANDDPNAPAIEASPAVSEILPAAANKVAVNDEDINAQVSAYPNPFSGSTVVSFVAPRTGKYTALLTDYKGSKLSILEKGETEKGKVTRINVSGTGLSNGVYFVKVEVAGVSKTIKLVFER